jgi:hypothetical protein
VNHADVKQYLADYLEGDLALAKRASVDAHLDQCADCAQEVDEMQRTIRMLRSMPDPETPPMIAANVMRRVRAGEAEPGFFSRIASALGAVLEPTFVLPASAIAAAALVAMIVQDPATFSRFTTNVTATHPTHPTQLGSPYDPSARVGRNAVSEIAGIDLSLPRALSDSRAQPNSAPPNTRRFQIEFDASAPLAPRRSAPSVASRFAPAPVFREGVPSQNPSDRSVATLRGVGRTASSVASTVASEEQRRAGRVARQMTANGFVDGTASSGGQDPRDEWLARGLESPAEFAQFLAEKNIAEHELWVSRLTERAIERGVLDDLVATLRASGNAAAAILGDDFQSEASEASEANESGSESADWGSPFDRRPERLIDDPTGDRLIGPR